MSTTRTLLAFVGMLLADGVAHAALVWEKSALELTAEQGQPAATAIFKFTNKGDKAVKITTVSTSCGCTVAKPAKDVFAPGESGELPAKISIGESAMTRHVSIQVETDEPKENAYSLSLTVEVASLVQVAPRLLLWKIGGELEAKSVNVTLHPGMTLADTALQGEGFSTRTEASPQGGSTVWVTPESTKERRLTTLVLTAKRDIGEPVVTKVFLRVAAP